MKRFLAHSAAAIFAVFTAANADVIPEFPKGYRAAHNEVVFEGLENFPDTAFVLYPAYHSGPKGKCWSLVRAGESARFYGLMGPKLYAVKRGTNRAFDVAFFPKPGSPPPRDFPVLDEALAAQLLTMPRSEKGFSKGYIKVADSSPTKSIQSVYRVTGIARRSHRSGKVRAATRRKREDHQRRFRRPWIVAQVTLWGRRPNVESGFRATVVVGADTHRPGNGDPGGAFSCGIDSCQTEAGFHEMMERRRLRRRFRSSSHPGMRAVTE